MSEQIRVIGCMNEQEKAYAKEILTQKGFLSLPQTEYIVFPGFCDVHVHLREPGFSYKETVGSGTRAAAAGGYTAVCSMPNLKPVPDSPETLRAQREIIERDAVIPVYPYGAITKDELGESLSDMPGMAKEVCAFSDDGRGVQSDAMMRRAMETARSLGRMIVAHCEVNSLLRGGYIHDGAYAKAQRHRGICSESEYAQIERDLGLVRETGCAYHVCHISTKESVELIRRAKAEGLDVTCETAPHYLVLSDRDLREEGRFKMNPPLRDETDRQALIEGILDGTVDMIATDHAPHSAEEKSKGLEGSPFGIVGLETAFPILYTELVRKGILSVEKLEALLCENPRRRFGLSRRGMDFCVFEVNTPYTIDSQAFCSMGRSTPFDGWEVLGRCVLTVCNGETIYEFRK